MCLESEQTWLYQTKISLENLVVLITKRLEIEFQTRVENQGILDVLNTFPSMVTRFVARKMHLLQTRVIHLRLSGSDLEQVSDDKDGRLPLEIVNI